MAKKRNHKRTKSRVIPVLSAIAVILLAVLLVMLGFLWRGSDGKPPAPADDTAPPDTLDSVTVTDTQPAPTVETNGPVEPENILPYQMEDGKLEISSLFQYSGLNPDCDWEEGTNVGAIVLTNRSGEYLETLDLTITANDGTVLTMHITDLPAGATVWAYDVYNTSVSDGVFACYVQHTASFRTDSGIGEDRVTVSTDSINVSLTNVSGETLTGLEIHCRSRMEDIYFGGMSYVYPAEDIHAGESVTVIAADCFLGDTDVTLIDVAE